MRARSSLVRAAAIRIAGCAVYLFPQDRSDWAKASINEVHHVPGDIRALRWALGIVVTAIHERIRSMKSGSLLVPRWLLGIEILVCFVPLTLLGVAVVASAAKGVMPIRQAFLYFSVAALGPIGLVAGFRKILRYSTGLGKGTVTVLSLAAGWTLLAYVSLFVFKGAPVAEWWREFVVIAFLPAVGAAHLIVISGRSSDTARLGL